MLLCLTSNNLQVNLTHHEDFVSSDGKNTVQSTGSIVIKNVISIHTVVSFRRSKGVHGSKSNKYNINKQFYIYIYYKEKVDICLL